MRPQVQAFRSLVLAMMLAGVALAQTTAPTASPFHFQPGQRVYVVAGRPWAQDQTALAPDLQIERRAKGEFEKRRKFAIVSSISEADFVFLIILDPRSSDVDELGLALLPKDYLARRNDFDALRSLALWQTSKALGYFDDFRHWHPSVSRKIVKSFHQEVLSGRQ